MSRLMSMLLRNAAEMAVNAMEGRNYGDVYGAPDRFIPRTNPGYKVRNKDRDRQLREFMVNGEKVMAYSKKDAYKRLKHRRK